VGWILHAWVCFNQIFIILAKLFFKNGKNKIKFRFSSHYIKKLIIKKTHRIFAVSSNRVENNIEGFFKFFT
jgi:hypothetical protein